MWFLTSFHLFFGPPELVKDPSKVAAEIVHISNGGVLGARKTRHSLAFQHAVDPPFTRKRRIRARGATDTGASGSRRTNLLELLESSTEQIVIVIAVIPTTTVEGCCVGPVHDPLT
jgi:hypothetical protein